MNPLWLAIKISVLLNAMLFVVAAGVRRDSIFIKVAGVISLPADLIINSIIPKVHPNLAFAVVELALSISVDAVIVWVCIWLFVRVLVRQGPIQP